jgi:hypothetical protein
VTSDSDEADPRARARRIVAEVLGTTDGGASSDGGDSSSPAPPSGRAAPPQPEPATDHPAPATAREDAGAGHAAEVYAGPVRSEAGEAAHRIVLAVLAAGRQGQGGSDLATVQEDAEPESGEGSLGVPPEVPEPVTTTPPEPERTWAEAFAHRIREEIVAGQSTPAVPLEPAAPSGPAEVGEPEARHPEAEEEDAAGPPPIPAALLHAAPAQEPPAELADGPAAGVDGRGEGSAPAAPVDGSHVDAEVAGDSPPATWTEQDAAAIARELVAQVSASPRQAVEDAAGTGDGTDDDGPDQPGPVPTSNPPEAPPIVAPEDHMRQLFAAPADGSGGADDAADVVDEPELVDGSDPPWELDDDVTPDSGSSPRTGRWLLATILGAVAIALLFPLAVAALRQVLALS